MQSMKEILTAVGELGSTGMIMVPPFNGRTQLGHKESRELLPELGEHAVQAKIQILFTSAASDPGIRLAIAPPFCEKPG